MNPITDGQLQPAWRLWGEEKVDGAVYNVYLKKVRYHPSSSVSFEDADDSISHLEWETVRIRIIKAGSLDRLVESLANDSGELESTYLNVFLSTYRSFATAQQVLVSIFERYKRLNSDEEDMSNEMKEQHRKTMARALMVWMDMHPEDFAEPPHYPTLNQILEFAIQFLPGSMLEIRTRHRLERCQREFAKSPRIITPPSSPDVDWYTSSTENDSIELCPTPVYDFHDISPSHFAAQLTWMDAELFKRLIPHHCLGSTWSRREKVRGWNAVTSNLANSNGILSNCSNTVTATVNQFNAVSARVISTVLNGLELESYNRALVITKWIDIAQELRVLKNFSSLKAVTAALQSNAIYRLKKTWMALQREKVEVFSELARIFSEENNQLNCRKLLLKEGTAKFADSVGEDDRQLQKLMQRQTTNQNLCTVQGTVPYLGTFLTDLTMIDTAIPDLLPDGLINFDKKRKEFEVLAQLKLLQSSANNYSIEPDPLFQTWFRSVNTLDDNESYEISCLIEPPSSSKKPGALHKSKSVENHLGHRKTNSTSSTSTTASSISQLYDQPNSDLSSTSSGLQPLQNNSISELKGSMMRLNLSLPSLNNYGPPTPPSNSPESMESPSYSPNHVPPFYIIRVSVKQSDQKTEPSGVNLYKSIMLYDRDHTRTVIQNAMIKHGIEGQSPDDYILSQLLPNGGEIEFPSSANVYYAINLNYELNFVLKPKQNDSTPNLSRKKGKLATNVPLVKRFLSSGSNSASNSSVSTMTSSTSAVT